MVYILVFVVGLGSGFLDKAVGWFCGILFYFVSMAITVVSLPADTKKRNLIFCLMCLLFYALGVFGGDIIYIIQLKMKIR